MIDPIKPDDIITVIPDEVIEAFNELIVKNFRKNQSVVKQDDIVNLIRNKMSLKNDDIVFDSGWLDIESLYIEAGWNVKYDEPGWGEPYDSYFVFSKG